MIIMVWGLSKTSDDDVLETYAVERCKDCGALTKRRFATGDVLFAESSKCTSCGGSVIIEKIFSQTMV